MAKYFQRIVAYPEGAGQAQDIYFELVPTPPPFDEVDLAFKRDIDELLTRLRAAFADREALDHLVRKLTMIADTALGGDSPNPEFARPELEALKKEIIVRANAVRDARIDKLVRASYPCLGVALLAFALWSTLATLAPGLAKLLPVLREDWINTIATFIGGYSLAIIGLLLGIVLVAFVSMRQVTFENFDLINVYRLSPPRYVLYISILTLVVCVILAFDIITLGVGSVILNDFMVTPIIGVLIGLSCAAAEPLMATSIMDALNPTAKNAPTSAPPPPIRAAAAPSSGQVTVVPSGTTPPPPPPNNNARQ